MRPGEDDASTSVGWSETIISDDEGGNAGDRLYEKVGGADRDSSVHTIRDFDGHEMIQFLSEDGKTSWELHSSIFAPESAVFARMFEYGRAPAYGAADPCEYMTSLIRIPGYRNGYRLHRVANSDFEAFLLAVRPKLGKQPTPEQLAPILVLATDWAFPDVRHYAIQELSKTEMLPIPKIILARRTQVPDWLEAPYVALSIRLAPLTMDEAVTLGLHATAAIGRAREKVIQRRIMLTSGEYPAAWMGSSFWHALCWATLKEAWNLALTHRKYKALTAPEALITALTDLKAPDSGRSFCHTCNDEAKLVIWLGQESDELTALAELKACLGTDIRVWLDKK